MERLRCLLVVGALAAVVSVVAAGPAVAAKGGNSENAHACQQGGHKNGFDAVTGLPFKNAGDCTNNGAQGEGVSSLQITTGTYPCPPGLVGTCWGTVSGSGLRPDGGWFVRDFDNSRTIASGSMDANGTLQQTSLNLPCGVEGAVGAFAQGLGEPPANIKSAVTASRCA
jgi:hypothetical protein